MTYHDFSLLGLDSSNATGSHRKNQIAKAPVILGYLLFAIGKSKQRKSGPIHVAELFCADAYYSFVASRFGADRCDAFDNNKDGHIEEAYSAKQQLADGKVHIHLKDIFQIESNFRADIVMNTGGLYHVTDPLRALERSYSMASRYLIVQTVTSLVSENVSYFETPAPGWKHGCRFSHAWIQNQIASRGYFVVDSERNILEGNGRLEDRGSSYFLIDTTRLI